MHISALPLLILALTLSGCSSESSTDEYLESAKNHISAGKLNSGLIETRNAVKSDPQNAEARALLGTLELQRGNPADAEKEIRKAIELGHSESDVTSELSTALLQLNQLDELNELSTDGLAAEDAAVVLANQADARLQDEDVAAAEERVNESLALASTFQAVMVQAKIQESEGDLSAALELARKASTLAEASGDAFEYLGDIEDRNGNTDDAIEAYSEAMNHVANSASSLMKRASAYLRISDLEKGTADLDSLTAAGVEHPWIDVTRGSLLFIDGKYLEAQQQHEEALQVAAEYMPAINGLAITHLASGNLGQAEQYAKQLLTDKEQEAQGRRLLGAIYLESQRYDRAQEVLTAMIGSGEIDLFSARMLGAALLRQGKYDQALDMLAFVSLKLQESGNADSSLALNTLPTQELLAESRSDGNSTASEHNPVTSPELLSELEASILATFDSIHRKRIPQAIEQAQQLKEQMPDSAIPTNLLGRAYLADDQPDLANAAFEESLQADPSNSSALNILANFDISKGDISGARNKLEKATDSSDASEASLISLARLEAEEENYAAMVDLLETAIRQYPESSTARVLLAQYWASQARHQRVLEVLNPIEGRIARTSEVLQLQAASNLQLRQYPESLEAMDQLLEEQPENVDWLYFRSQVQAGLSNAADMTKDLDKALSLDPDHVPAQLAKARLDMLNGDMESAEQRVDKLRGQIPGTAELENVVAALDAAKNQRADGNKAIQIENDEQLVEAASMLWSRGSQDDAIGLVEKWIEARPDSVKARLALAELYGAVERISDAVVQYEQVLELENNNPTALNNLAWHLRGSAPDRAVSYANSALEVNPESVDTLDTLAMIHLGNDAPAEAKAAFDRLMEIGTDNPTILFHGASIEQALGNNGAAVDLLEQLVSSGAEFPEAEAAADLLQQLK